jgi:hypothetical protein
MNGEIILRGLVLVLFIPAIGAIVAYLTGHPSTAMVFNGVVPLLVFAASALVIVSNPPTRVSVVGALYFVVPLVVLLGCGVGLRRRSVHPALFWFTWAVDVAIVAFLFYLSFVFTIF